jgi:hypothetical protein
MLFPGSVVVACSLIRWFIGCWLCLFGSSLRFGALGLQLGLFVLSRWFGACCFLLFDSTLQGWGPTPIVGDIFFIFIIVIIFWALYGVHPLHPRVGMQLCYLPYLERSIIYFVVRFCW